MLLLYFICACAHISIYVCVYIPPLGFIPAGISNEFCFMVEKSKMMVFFRMRVLFFKLPLMLELVGP